MKKLFDFFHDLRAIEEHKDDYPNLKRFYLECSYLIEKKAYGDINVQDEKGNTFLHYVFENMKWNWALKLLYFGADPHLLNNEKRSAFHMAPPNGSINQFWTNFNLLSFDKSFKKNTKGYCLKFKNTLIEYLCMQWNAKFNNFEEIKSFLIENDINSKANRLSLLLISFKIDATVQLKIFLDNFETPEENSRFLNGRNFITQTQHPSLNNKNILADFYSRTFANNENFLKGVKSLIEANYAVNEIINILVRQNINLDEKYIPYTESLREIVNSNKEASIIYDYLKLNSILVNEYSFVKKVKI